MQEGTIPTKIYPHSAVAFFAIFKHYLLTAPFLALAFWFNSHSPYRIALTLSFWAATVLLIQAFLYTLYAILHYTQTYLEITNEGILYNVGWIPNRKTTLLWTMIKDVESSVSIPEGVLRTGSILFMIVIRNQSGLFKISYLPNHNELTSYIRTKIANLNTVNYI